jgi:predicted nuclease with TOPRIM domain
MRDKKIVYFFSALLLFSGLLCSVDALSDTTVSFRGGGVTIDLTYPKEAYPNTNITHYITITSSTTVTLKNFTVVIKALVNSSWQEILNGMNVYGIPPQLPQSYNLTLSLPQDANGMLQCFIFVNTSSVDDLSTIFYTTLVSDPTFSEIQSMYAALWEDYNSLQADYETLLNEYDGLLANYSSLLANYTALLSQYNDLSEDYNSQVVTYESLLAQYNKLSDDYDDLNSNYRSKISDLGDLQAEYDELNSTSYSLQANYTSLQSEYDALNQTYTDLQTELTNLQERITRSENALNSDRIVMFIFIITVAALIAFIVYMKRKKEEPYVVIRKETVSVKKEGS